MRSTAFAITVLFLLSGSAWGQQWTRARLVVSAGQQAGPIQLGRPLSPEVYRVLGQPTARTEPTPGPDGMDTGSVVWTDGPVPSDLNRGVLAKLNDGQGDQNVFTVILSGVRAVTDRGVYLGAPLSKVRQAYPEGSQGFMEMDEARTWEVPGLTFVLGPGDRVVQMVLTPTHFR